MLVSDGLSALLKPAKSLLFSLFPNFYFAKWWSRFSVRAERLPPILKDMVDYFVTTPAFHESSKYWHELNRKNLLQLEFHGYENFKQTVARNYFTWVSSNFSGYCENLIRNQDDLAATVDIHELLKKHSLFSLEESYSFNLITVLLYQYTRKKLGERMADYLVEPMEGNPPFITLEGRPVTQDSLNSLLEFSSITGICGLEKLKCIVEVGAGFGRTSFYFLSKARNLKYIIVDIPPALFISQQYLSTVFADRAVVPFRNFQSFSEIEEEFHRSDIVFLMPDQMRHLPDRSVDLFLAIDCLHEMKRNAVDFYFDEVERLAQNFYFKCWEHTVVPFDGLVYRMDDYPVKKSWLEVFKRPVEVPKSFFEGFYLTTP